MGGLLPLGKYISTTPCSTRSAGRCWQDRSQPRPGRGLHRGPGPGPGRSVGPAAASVGLASSRRGPGRRQRWPGPRYPPGVQLCGGPAQGAPWAKAAVDRAWARRGPGRLSSRRRPGRWLRRGLGPGPGRSVGLAAASAELASSRRGPGRLSSAAFAWAEAAVARATVPPRRSILRRTCPGRALGEGSGRSGLGAPWTRAAQLATSVWAVAPSRTWA